MPRSNRAAPMRLVASLPTTVAPPAVNPAVNPAVSAGGGAAAGVVAAAAAAVGMVGRRIPVVRACRTDR
jgi:hypothetical protein